MWGKVLQGSSTRAVTAVACCCGLLAAGVGLYTSFQKFDERKRASKPGGGFVSSSTQQRDDLLQEWKEQFALMKKREREMLQRSNTKLWWAPTEQGRISFELDINYIMRNTIGSGGYGVVVAAVDTTKHTKVAIKKVASAFDDILVGERTIREVSLLRQLHHPNIIGIVDMLPPPSVGKFEDVYMVLDRMDTDLDNVITSGRHLTEINQQLIMYQILCALHYMHSARVIHRDLKPENVLVDTKKGDIKLCDFGLARSLGPGSDVEDSDSGGNSETLTEYVVTRWWRAPEVLLDTNYGTAIDVWSAGCIMAEMLQREPLFMGSDTAEMLRLVVQFTGKPSEADLSSVTSQKTRNYVLDMTEDPQTSLPEKFPGAGSDALDLLSRMLTFNPARRISVRDAMRHPWFAGQYEEDDETPAPKPADLTAVENLPLTRPNLQQLIFEEVCAFRPECRAMAPGGT